MSKMRELSAQLSQLVDKSNPRNIMAEIRTLFCHHYGCAGAEKLEQAFYLIEELFSGEYPGYQACNTEYHDLSHTLDATLATCRLLDGANLTGPALPQDLARDLILAALFHDCGYIQEEWDQAGTGAKFTTNHVERSVGFVVRERERFSITTEQATLIGRLIRSTGLSVEMNSISFVSPEERMAGAILGTADLLGQMSDRTYLEKLLFLYKEFREARINGFNTEYDIIRKTVDFYEVVKSRLRSQYQDAYRFARQHFRTRYGIDRNLYIVAINRHINYLRKIVQDSESNFRHKLRRADWLEQEPDSAGGSQAAM